MEGPSVHVIGAMLKGLFPTAGAVSYRFGHDGLLHALEARRGRGKSYLMTQLVLDLAARRVRMVTNTASLDFYRMALYLVQRGAFPSMVEALGWFAVNVRFARTWDDIFTAYDAVVIFDEATRLFDGRKGMAVRVPMLFFEWAKQSRKMRCTTYFITHSLEWLDKRVTQLLDMFWQVRKVSDKNARAPDGTPLPVRFYAYGIDPGGAGRVENVGRATADFVVTVPFRRRVAECYDSWGLINEISGESRFSTVADIKAWHEERGRVLGRDGEEKLVWHLGRLAGDADADTATPSGVSVSASASPDEGKTWADLLLLT